MTKAFTVGDEPPTIAEIVGGKWEEIAAAAAELVADAEAERQRMWLEQADARLRRRLMAQGLVRTPAPDPELRMQMIRAGSIKPADEAERAAACKPRLVSALFD